MSESGGGDTLGIRSMLGFDYSPFSSGMLAVNSIASIFPQTVQNFMASPLLGLAGIASDAASAIKGAFLDVAHAADDAGESAQKLGVSVDFLTGYGRAAADAGSSAEGFADALKFVNKNAAEAAGGNKEVKAAFESIGISVTDSAGKVKGTETLWHEIAAGLDAIPDASKRTQVAMDLLGRGGNDMLAALKAGEELNPIFQRLGANIDESLAAGADKFGTIETVVGAAIDGMKNSLAAPFLKVFGDNYDEIVDKVLSLSESMRPALQSVGEALAPLIMPAINLLTQLMQVIGPVISAVGTLASLVTSPLAQVVNAFAGSGAVGGVGAATAPGGPQAPRSVVYNLDTSVNLPGVDAKTAADHMAATVASRLQRAMEDRDDQQRAENERAATEGGL